MDHTSHAEGDRDTLAFLGLGAMGAGMSSRLADEGFPLVVWNRSAGPAADLPQRDGIDEASFVEMRTRRDATLEMPVLLLPSVQVNIRAGELPPPEANGVSYLKLPVNAL